MHIFTKYGFPTSLFFEGYFKDKWMLVSRNVATVIDFSLQIICGVVVAIIILEFSCKQVAFTV